MARYLDHLLKVRQLRIVNALSDQGSISRASRALGLSQPALTKALQQLEATVGARLFSRAARGVQPTAAGFAVIEASRRILTELRRLDEELDRVATNMSSSIAVGATPSASVGLLPKVLAWLRANAIDVQVRLIEGSFEDLAPALSVGEIDLLVGRLYDMAEPDGFTREELYDNPIALLVGQDHPLLREAPTLAAVSRYQLIVPPHSRRYGQEVDRLLSRAPDLRATLIRSSSLGFAREMIHATDAVVLAPRLMMAADIERGAVRAVALELETSPRPSGVTYRSDAPLSVGAAAFVKGLKAVTSGVSS